MPDFPGLNTQWIPHDLGRFGMPKLQRCDLVPDQLWPYDERIKSPEYDDDLPEDVVLHFFLRDAAFNSTWTYQDRCIESLKRFNGVIAPNFSLYADWPQAVQIWNCYRSHWLGAYWSQVHGIPVIPCVNWADPSSYEFCFAGLPVGGTFALATMEVDTDTETVLFLQGFVEFLRRCQTEWMICLIHLMTRTSGICIGCSMTSRMAILTVPLLPEMDPKFGVQFNLICQDGA